MEGYDNALAEYLNECIYEWVYRGYNNTMEFAKITDDVVYPNWLGNDLFHSSHRANLLRKDYNYYHKFIWKEDPDNPYAWYDIDKQQWYLQHVGTGKREYVL